MVEQPLKKPKQDDTGQPSVLAERRSPIGCGCRTVVSDLSLQSRAALIVIALALLLNAGCIPYYRESYYKPSAEVGAPYRDPCGQPPREWNFTLGRVVLGVRAYETTPGTEILLGLTIPYGSVVRVLSNVVHVISEIQAVEARLSDAHRVVVRPGPRTEYPIDDPIPGGYELFRPFFKEVKVPYQYLFRAQPEIGRSKEFALRLPSIAVDGVQHQLPEVRFTTATHHAVFSPINC